MDNVITVVDSFGDPVKTFKVPEGRIDFEQADLCGVHLYDAQLSGRSFKGAMLYWAAFSGANLTDANFENADLRGSILADACCTGANFRYANLGLDNLGGSTKLQGSDLTGAILNRANLTGAEFDDETVFPKGFHPLSHGMIEKEC